jgi:TRAP-type mannitol/chloroaromatic compound transport system substrate-binding protein
VDAAEFICPFDDEKLGLPKVARYNHYPCWWESAGMLHVIINLERWAALPKRYQAILAHACEAATLWMLQRYEALNAGALKRLIQAGAILKPFPPPVMEAFHKAAGEHYAELAGRDPAFRRAYESANAYRKEHLHWLQVAGHAYDSFMIGVRGRV